MKNALKKFAKSVLKTLGLAAIALATDAGIQNKFFGSGLTTLIISNREMDDIMKIVKLLDDDGFLMKGVSEAIKCKTNKQTKKQKNKKQTKTS